MTDRRAGAGDSTGAGRAGRDRRGFALLIVLWTMVLLSLLITHLSATGRSETHIAQNYASNAQAESQADGVVFESAFRVIQGDWVADGSPHELNMAHGKAVVALFSESGKINPNIASVDLLSSLLRVIGVDQTLAGAVAAAIADWREPGDQPRPNGAKAAQYRAAGLDYGPPNSPFESIDEVGRVLGVTPEIFHAIAPHLTLYQFSDPDPSLADPVVVQALKQLPNGANQQPFPAALSGGLQTLTIRAEARSESGGYFIRRAVLRVGPAFERGFQILAWEGPG